jgi:O-methyltransferase involved in polyketide biosynthesis
MGPVMARGEYTDIPFAKEILFYLKNHAETPPVDPQRLASRASFFEARFKAVSLILAEQRIGQIMELASGYSPRSLDPALRRATFVEVDLPKMIARKKQIVTALLGAIPSHPHFCGASVLNADELAQGLTHFRPEPVAVTSEGLLRYLTFDEKAQLAANVKRILQRFGGVWITPDIHLKEWSPARTGRGGEGSFTAQLGRDINVNYFDDLAHARSFFEGCGFQVDERPLLEPVRERVVSLPLTPPDLLAELESRKIFIMT